MGQRDGKMVLGCRLIMGWIWVVNEMEGLLMGWRVGG